MIKTSLAPFAYDIRKNNILTNVIKTLKRARNAFSKGLEFHFPSIDEIHGPPPLITSNLGDVITDAEELSSYYAVASIIEGYFANACKEKRA